MKKNKFKQLKAKEKIDHQNKVSCCVSSMMLIWNDVLILRYTNETVFEDR